MKALALLVSIMFAEGYPILKIDCINAFNSAYRQKMLGVDYHISTYIQSVQNFKLANQLQCQSSIASASFFSFLDEEVSLVT